jgi:hypothetical protein
MCAGSEAYQSALVFYNSAKVAAGNDVTGAKAVYEELRKRFPSTRRRNPAPRFDRTEVPLCKAQAETAPLEVAM